MPAVARGPRAEHALTKILSLRTLLSMAMIQYTAVYRPLTTMVDLQARYPMSIAHVVAAAAAAVAEARRLPAIRPLTVRVDGMDAVDAAAGVDRGILQLPG